MNTKFTKILVTPLLVLLTISALSGCNTPNPGPGPSGDDDITLTILDKSGNLIDKLKTGKDAPIYRNSIKDSFFYYENNNLNSVFNHFFLDQEFTKIIPSDFIYTEDLTVYANYIDVRYESVSYREGNSFRTAFRNYNTSVTTLKRYGLCRAQMEKIDRSTTDPSKVTSIHDGKLYTPSASGTSGTNREHVWPCDLMDPGNLSDYRPAESSIGHYTDIVNLRLTTYDLNTARASKWYGDPSVEGHSQFFLPQTDRGEVARILFYMTSAYDIFLTNYEDRASTNAPKRTYGNLSEILKWWEENPVSQFEINRQDGIEEYQGNRNPFVDEPQLAYSLYDFANYNTW